MHVCMLALKKLRFREHRAWPRFGQRLLEALHDRQTYVLADGVDPQIRR